MGRWCPPWVKFQHLERYRWACRYVKERVVLDAACGTGYGSQMLLHQGKAALVYGVDLSEAAIKEATSCLADENARWSLGDVTKLDFQNDSIDVYVSFETLEHVPNDVGYVAEAARVVKPDGVFLCSTPNRKLFHPGATLETKPQNPFHVREYVKEELESLLKNHFGEISWFGQTAFSQGYTRFLSAISQTSKTLSFRSHQATKLMTMSFASSVRHAVLPLEELPQAEVLVACCSLPKKP
ncbi:putative S-adenosylmethionine-dependent methyltransferase/MSMEI_2290 [Planctopirus ephydatiae]|uniref:Putative S-adenosylmethionine-dependent methyltransferase/MSMEI_2290 n=1 Tax=Planctopirus ephydatiae TaxID=2528019 RepID=A0A518GIV1_9PLAN|nr:class I SAM-dependent methyltransferase [Planctopirus ephydatiae]QDV28525.1 putative S-adenosylmethionine-dependent methyltransferase/MSMEI_2290 [Planctopirus ephydatiae]